MTETESEASPLSLVEFPNANLEKANCIKYELYKNLETCAFKKPKRILVADNGHLKYSGSNYESKAEISSLLKIGIFNKKCQKLKLYDVDFFQMKPLLKCHMDVKATGKRFQSDDLVLAFGSKIRKKMINSRINFASTETGTIDNALLKPDTDEKLVEGKGANVRPESDVIPPQNKNAASVSEVYDIYDIITVEEYEALESHAEVFLDVTYEKIALWKQDNVYCDVVTTYLESSCGSLTLHNAKLLCYLQYMMCFLKLTYQDVRKKDPIPHVPEPFKQKLKDRFFLRNRSFPQRMKDKLLAYAMVLALTLYYYNLNGKLLAASSRIPIKKIVLVAHALGCYVRERKDDAKWIELKLPLHEYKMDKPKK